MKTLHISKFSIFIIAILVIAFVSFGVVVYSSPSTVSNQDERIYLRIPGYSDDVNFEGFVKISDMKPNSAGVFMYPSSFRYEDRYANAYQTFLLIRLPKEIGGDKNDTSAFRAYSALDPASHCLMKYWPQEGRQRIEDPCTSPPYRAIDGVSYVPRMTTIRAPTTGALPKLDLGVDNQGYLVVKPPAFTQDRNGAIGVGRNISQDEVIKSSQILADHCKNQMKWPSLPFELQTGDVLMDITCGNNQFNAFYANNDDLGRGAWVNGNFCNCTKTPHELGPWIISENGQLWNTGNDTIYVSGNALQTGENKVDQIYAEYTFRFVKNGYDISFTDRRSFDDSAKEVLRDFFDNSSITDLKRIK